MDFNQYSSLALRTANTPALEGKQEKITCAALGLAGEGGEIADHVKKWLFQGHSLDEAKLIKELGDNLWYINLMATALGLTLEELAAVNIAKIYERYPGGNFTPERSINRKEYAHIDGHEVLDAGSLATLKQAAKTAEV
jgi:NTP pyrophosphatase (non-canonical NTP hydrolase)